MRAMQDKGAAGAKAHRRDHAGLLWGGLYLAGGVRGLCRVRDEMRTDGNLGSPDYGAKGEGLSDKHWGALDVLKQRNRN